MPVARLPGPSGSSFRLIRSVARSEFNQERIATKVQTYREWVEDRAEAGDIAAARQLRGFLYRDKRAIRERGKNLLGEAPSIESANRKKYDPVFHAIASMHWEVNRKTGDVTYKLDGKNSFVDSGQKLHLLDKREATLVASLKVGQQKFGGLGEPAPVGKQFEDLPFDKAALYRMLLNDHVAPVRIVLGYGGFKTEQSLRQGCLNFIAQNPKIPGFAGSSLPSLIVCAENSIVKTNGQPFYFQPWQGRYLCYASSSHSPILWILNLILTRISHLYASPDWYSRDLSIDRFTPLLWGKAADMGNVEGWEYWEHPVSPKDLGQVPVLTKEEWQPVKISQHQAVLLQLIGNDGITKTDVLAEMSSIDLTDEQTLTLIDDLIAKRLLGWDRDALVFLTRRCATAFTPKDGIVAHDMEDERFAEWMSRAGRWNKPASRVE